MVMSKRAAATTMVPTVRPVSQGLPVRHAAIPPTSAAVIAPITNDTRTE